MTMILAVTNDEYEHIVYMTKSQRDMARLTGVSNCTISRQIRGERQSMGRLKFVEVDMDNPIDELRELIEEVSIDIIADNLNEERLWNWCGAWRQRAHDALDEIEQKWMNGKEVKE